VAEGTPDHASRFCKPILIQPSTSASYISQLWKKRALLINDWNQAFLSDFTFCRLQEEAFTGADAHTGSVGAGG
jgi:hypothetical protein